jgi:hypothetical protein
MTQLGVRTVQDTKKGNDELEILHEESNPFRTGALKLSSVVHQVYSVLRFPGLLCAATLWWGMYPKFARLRHNHIKRFRRRQVEFREGLFHTKNITKVRNASEVRPGWKGWALFFVFARWFQQATEMPDMQAFPM